LLLALSLTATQAGHHRAGWESRANFTGSRNSKEPNDPCGPGRNSHGPYHHPIIIFVLNLQRRIVDGPERRVRGEGNDIF